MKYTEKVISEGGFTFSYEYEDKEEALNGIKYSLNGCDSFDEAKLFDENGNLVAYFNKGDKEVTVVEDSKKLTEKEVREALKPKNGKDYILTGAEKEEVVARFKNAGIIEDPEEYSVVFNSEEKVFGVRRTGLFCDDDINLMQNLTRQKAELIARGLSNTMETTAPWL